MPAKFFRRIFDETRKNYHQRHDDERKEIHPADAQRQQPERGQQIPRDDIRVGPKQVIAEIYPGIYHVNQEDTQNCFVETIFERWVGEGIKGA